MFLKSHDSAFYLDTLLHACTHYVHYDVQCEDSRVPYLWRLIEISGRPDFFRQALHKILLAGKDNPDDITWSQVFGLARHFASQGADEMRRAMYAAFKELGFEKAGNSSAAELVHLDGIEGFLFAATLFDIDSLDTEIWEFYAVIGALEDKIGKENARNQFSDRARDNERLQKLFAKMLEYWQGLETSSGERVRMDYLALKARPADLPWSSDLFFWARTANPEELAILARDLLLETDEKRLESMLRIFSSRPFPENPEGLLALANDERLKIRHRALGALRNVSHPSVRHRALELLRSADRFDDGIDLLVSNYERGDFALIWNVLQRATNPDVIHGMSSALESMNKKYSDQEAEKLLLWLYENNPCSMCRTDYVHGLLTMERLPDWMREECLYDADESTVKEVTEAASSAKTA